MPLTNAHKAWIAGVGLATVAVAAGGWAAASAFHPGDAPASEGRVLALRYVRVEPPPYRAPPVTEETRLAVLTDAAPVAVDAGVYSAQAAAAWRTLQQDDTRRMVVSLAQVRAEDARIARETAGQLELLHARYAVEPASGDDDEDDDAESPNT